VSLPFSHDAFLDVFAAYNRAWWPVAAVLWIATVSAIIQLVRGRTLGRGLVALLAIHWAWSGIAYHAGAFAAINPAAPLFAVLFLVQAFAFAWTGVIRGRLAFAWGRSWRHWLAALLLGAAVVYPGVAWATVNAWPRLPTFGVPCPTTLFTAGCLLAAVPAAPRGCWSSRSCGPWSAGPPPCSWASASISRSSPPAQGSWPSPPPEATATARAPGAGQGANPEGRGLRQALSGPARGRGSPLTDVAAACYR
jgi:hypothetical protein